MKAAILLVTATATATVTESKITDIGIYANATCGKVSACVSINDAPPQDVVDAVLTGFINDIGIMQGVDYALYASDLAKDPEPSGPNETSSATGGAQPSSKL